MKRVTKTLQPFGQNVYNFKPIPVLSSPTSARPEGVDGNLTSELFRHSQDAHGHAVLCHCVRWEK